jgi:hypothetical protein
VERAIGAATPLAVVVALKDTGVDVGAGPGHLRAISALYDPEHATDVASGENEGARLREYRIVRQVDVLGEWDGVPRHFAVPPPGSGQGQVILVQTADLRVVGAAHRPPAGQAKPA